jgi:hypothetical protein
MASLRRSTELKAPRIMLHAVHGIGKTSLGAGMRKPVILQTEDGLGMIDMPTFGLLKTYAEVMESIASLYSEDHEFETVVLDSLDWLEPLVWVETCRLNNWRDIEQPGYGKGYAAALDTWRGILDGLNALRDERKMTITMIAHTEPKRFESPEVEAYDRYAPKLQKAASALVQEHVDCVWFMNYRVSVVKDDKKDPSSRARGVGVDSACSTPPSAPRIWQKTATGCRNPSRCRMTRSRCGRPSPSTFPISQPARSKRLWHFSVRPLTHPALNPHSPATICRRGITRSR